MAVLTEEQVMLKDAAKSWVGERSPVAALRKLRDQDTDVGFDRAAFGHIAVHRCSQFGAGGGQDRFSLSEERFARRMTAGSRDGAALIEDIQGGLRAIRGCCDLAYGAAQSRPGTG